MTMHLDEQWDVVVLGSGVGGFATALASAEEGFRTLVLEKADVLGGGTSRAYGGMWFGNNHLARAEGLADSREEVIAYMQAIGGDDIDMKKLLCFVDRSPEALQFFERCGMRFRITHGFPDHYYGKLSSASAEGRSLEPELISLGEIGEWADRVYTPQGIPLEVTVEEVIKWGGLTYRSAWQHDVVEERARRRIRGRGVALIVHFLKQLLARDVSLRTSAAAQRLLIEGGAVIGVEMPDGRRIGAGKAVVLATGGYESNPELAQTYEGLPGWQSMFPSSVAGDGMIMGTECGAAVRIIHNNLALFLGYEIPITGPERVQFHLAGITELLSPHTIVVNDSGLRFADESYFQDVAPKLRDYDYQTHRHPNLPCFLIFDRQYADAFSFAGRPIGAPIPDWVARADTVQELASKLRIDASGLATTVARFNQYATSGVDKEFGRGGAKWSLADGAVWADADRPLENARLGSIAEPPFYGIELHPSAFASAGVLTNMFGQVMHQRGHPIPGLYAVGNVAAHNEYGVGYQAGYSLASGMTFGYLAARHMNGREA